MDVTVTDNKGAQRYEAFIDGERVAIADYEIANGVAVMPHTEVLAHLRGQGIGDELVRQSLDLVRADGLKVAPRCWFVREYIDRNPEYADLVAS